MYLLILHDKIKRGKKMAVFLSLRVSLLVRHWAHNLLEDTKGTGSDAEKVHVTTMRNMIKK